MSTFLTIDEVIDFPLLGSNDLLKRNKGRMLKWSKLVYQDLQLSVLKMPNRQFFNINKRTNSINLPCEYTQLSSVNLVDRWGNFFPVWRNERLTGEIVDIAASRDCSCEYNCGYKLCNTIKGYEATTEVIEDKMPDNSDVSFTCVTRKTIDKTGNLVEQKQYPQRVYESGVWVDTVLYTETIRLCAVEVDTNGCVCDTEENIEAVCGTCCSNTDVIPFGGNSMNPPCDNPNIDTWKYYCNSKLDWFSVQCGQEARCHNPFRDIYNISEDGNRLIFPAKFGFDRVLVRWYGTMPTAQIKVPLLAVDAFATGLLYYDHEYSADVNDQRLASVFGDKYAKKKWGLFSDLNKRRISEYRMILTPPVFVPSYIGLGNGYNNNINNYYD
jgi:hypothetical protein